MGLRIFCPEYSWLENRNHLRGAARQACRQGFEELRCNAHQCLPGRKPICASLWSHAVTTFWTVSSSTASPSAGADGQRLSDLLQSDPEHLNARAIVPSPPSHSTLASPFLASRFFSALCRAFFFLEDSFLSACHWICFLFFPALIPTEDTTLMVKKRMRNNSLLGEIFRNTVVLGLFYHQHVQTET